MKYEIRLVSIEKQIPASFRLPATFNAFVETCKHQQRGDLGWFAIKYTKPKDLMEFDPKSDVVPFLRLPDGGLVAFWFAAPRKPAIVHIGSEGDANIVAANWSDFLSRLSKKRSSVPDLDDQELNDFPKIRGARVGKLQPLGSLKKKWQRWLDEHSVSEETSGTADEGESINQQMLELLKPDFDDYMRNWKKRYGDGDGITPRIHLVAHLTSRSYWVKKPSGQPYPHAKKLRPVFDRLVTYLGRPLKQADITVWANGTFYVDKNISIGNTRT
ncbi:MAG: hypothetical protein AAGG48_04320 [Planctomycetota bacterium]